MHVSVHAEVVEVPCDASRERGVLLLDRLMSMASTPVGDGSYEPSEARCSCPDPWHPSSTPSSAPVVREPEEVEGCASLAVLLHPLGTSERHHAGFLGMEPHPISFEALPQRSEHLPRVGLVLKADHGIVRVPDQAGPTADS